MRWEWGLFTISTTSGLKHVYGSVWGQHWGIHRSADKWFVVTHLPSRRRLTQFDRLRIGRRFCETIDGLTDWDTPTPSAATDLQLQIHRTALRLTGSRPALRVLAGGRG
jgi:hypothetical protein